MDHLVVGITTAPRIGCTLKQCARRTVQVGFPPPVIFAEPNSTSTEFLTYHNPKTLGAWHNWKKMVSTLLDLFPAEHYLLMQDDCYFINEGTYSFVSKILYPKGAGFVSLYTPTHYAHASCNRKKPPAVSHLQTQTSLGALAMVFPRAVLQEMTTTKAWSNWIGRRPANNVVQEYQHRIQHPEVVKHVDNAIGEMIQELKRTYWYVVPSLAKHIGVNSVLGHGPNTLKRNAEYAVSEKDDLNSLIPLPENLERPSDEEIRSTKEDDSSRRYKGDQVAWWSDSNLDNH